ncbi:hypothetical protein N656DRAFT_104338 [Canariomyces notabilis]|uniref:Uncharacterized protein n=1 Tax=Canariomyces notabilis TaxID=2074819 RepID=A0AAN6YSK8_9PEZI|nr:hypothetical protein N656DRAFT_104338 [Canariomyces arenarius]
MDLVGPQGGRVCWPVPTRACRPGSGQSRDASKTRRSQAQSDMGSSGPMKPQQTATPHNPRAGRESWAAGHLRSRELGRRSNPVRPVSCRFDKYQRTASPHFCLMPHHTLPTTTTSSSSFTTTPFFLLDAAYSTVLRPLHPRNHSRTVFSPLHFVSRRSLKTTLSLPPLFSFDFLLLPCCQCCGSRVPPPVENHLPTVLFTNARATCGVFAPSPIDAQPLAAIHLASSTAYPRLDSFTRARSPLLRPGTFKSTQELSSEPSVGTKDFLLFS